MGSLWEMGVPLLVRSVGKSLKLDAYELLGHFEKICPDKTCAFFGVGVIFNDPPENLPGKPTAGIWKEILWFQKRHVWVLEVPSFI